MISNGVRLIQDTPLKKIAVIGGRRTIRSGIYQRKLKSSKRSVVGRVAQPLSALIEQGELDSKEMHRALTQILSPFRAAKASRPDGLLMACTHYPAIDDLFAQYLPNCRLLDPAKMTAAELLQKTRSSQSAGRPFRLEDDAFITTGDPVQSKRSARLAFGLTISRFLKTSLRFKEGKSP